MNDPKWTVKWLHDRVYLHHHQVVTDYLVKRDARLAKEHELAGWPLDRVLREGFDINFGPTAVPQAAMKVLKKCPDADPRVVWDIVRSTSDTRQHLAFEVLLDKIVAQAVRASDSRLAEVHKEVCAFNAVRAVMWS